MTTETINGRDVMETVAQVEAAGVRDDGTGDLGIIVRQGLRDGDTVQQIVETIREARADARTEAARESN